MIQELNVSFGRANTAFHEALRRVRDGASTMNAEPEPAASSTDSAPSKPTSIESTTSTTRDHRITR
ncbi:MAG: hypothetical protein HOQ05_10635 [Corynebacteriales bacterium]|nr:hypothetical protein [Mycobacteriales bacterium]